MRIKSDTYMKISFKPFQVINESRHNPSFSRSYPSMHMNEIESTIIIQVLRTFAPESWPSIKCSSSISRASLGFWEFIWVHKQVPSHRASCCSVQIYELPLQQGCWSMWDAKARWVVSKEECLTLILSLHDTLFGLQTGPRLFVPPCLYKDFLVKTVPFSFRLTSPFSIGSRHQPVWNQSARQASRYALHFLFSAPRNLRNVFITGPLSPATWVMQIELVGGSPLIRRVQRSWHSQ